MLLARSFLLLAMVQVVACGGVRSDGGGVGGGGDIRERGYERGLNGAAGGSGADPCASKQCGDVCSLCDPADPSCAAHATELYCDDAGDCAARVPTCGGSCSNDADCGYGVEWCVGGACVPCDDTGGACDLDCPSGWQLYERNGCGACACAPVNECIMDGDCPMTAGGTPECYAGSFCWDWCPPGEPSCCYGNTCSVSGCSGVNPAGCAATGCPAGEACVAEGCAPSSCACNQGVWVCTADCAGGVCAHL
jgi:hypothetical protein